MGNKNTTVCKKYLPYGYFFRNFVSVGFVYESHASNNKIRMSMSAAISKCVYGLAVAVSFVACNRVGIEGKWVEPVPGMEGEVQGVSLERDGRASSINMATLRYDKWEREGDNLILFGESIGNGQTISFIDTLSIEKLTADELVLKKGEWTIDYKKQ